MQPRLTRGGIVIVDPKSTAVLRVIALQYNPDNVTRTLAIQAAGPEGDRLEALRFKGPPAETIKIEAAIDATDQLEFPERNTTTVQNGIFPQLAVLETLVYPTTRALHEANNLAQRGSMEIAPAEAPLTLFVWSRMRVVPVRIVEFSVTEEAFDPTLNPLRARVNLGMRVLSVNDLGFEHRGGNLFMAYLATKQRLARLHPAAGISSLGITGVA